MPNFSGAVVAIAAHATGIAKSDRGTGFAVSSSMPNVKIVVGHGSPNDGERGYG